MSTFEDFMISEAVNSNACLRQLEEKFIAVKSALREAIAEIEEHNSEYQHHTQQTKIEEWKKLLSA